MRSGTEAVMEEGRLSADLLREMVEMAWERIAEPSFELRSEPAIVILLEKAQELQLLTHSEEEQERLWNLWRQSTENISTAEERQNAHRLSGVLLSFDSLREEQLVEILSTLHFATSDKLFARVLTHPNANRRVWLAVAQSYRNAEAAEAIAQIPPACQMLEVREWLKEWLARLPHRSLILRGLCYGPGSEIREPFRRLAHDDAPLAVEVLEDPCFEGRKVLERADFLPLLSSCEASCRLAAITYLARIESGEWEARSRRDEPGEESVWSRSQRLQRAREYQALPF